MFQLDNKQFLMTIVLAHFLAVSAISQSYYFNKNLDQGRSELNTNLLLKDSFLYTNVLSNVISNTQTRNTIYKISKQTGVLLDSLQISLDSVIFISRELNINDQGDFIVLSEYKNTINDQFCVMFSTIKFDQKEVNHITHCSEVERLVRNSYQSFDKTSIGVGVSNMNGYSQFYMVELDSSGEILEEHFYGNPGYQVAWSIAQLPDSGYVIAGWARQSNSFFLDLMLVRTDKDGNQKWMKKYGGPRDDGGGRHVLVLKNGNILVTCSRHWEGTNKPENYAMVVRPDNGNIIWEKRYFHEHNSSFYTNAIEQDDGHIIVGGFKQVFVNTINRLEIYSTITKLDKTGNLVYERLLYYNPYKQNYLTGLTQDPDGGFWGYGWTFNTNQDGWLIKVDSLGCPFPDCDSISVSTGELSSETDICLRAYPNPASQNTIIHYQFSKQVASPMLEIFDLHGKLITRLPLNGEAPQGDVWMDLSDWVPGMYVMRIVSQGQILATGKMVKGN